jgi:hypothetical protein
MGEIVQWDYDEEMDVLYISFGDPKPGIGDEVAEMVVLRTDPDTDQYVGITIIGFKEMAKI